MTARDPQPIAEALRPIVGAQHVLTDPAACAAYTVHGVSAGCVVGPANIEELAAVLRVAQELRATVVPWGGGTQQLIGNPPQQADLLVRTERLNRVRSSGGRLIAVGTTSLRLLESAADDSGTIRPFAGDTAIFITPGYRFKAIDGLLTNFHLPKSTLFMLVSALMGLDVMKSAYAHAIERNYRFYSYGDASLLLP